MQYFIVFGPVLIVCCYLFEIISAMFMSLSDFNVVYGYLRVAVVVMLYFVPSTMAISSSVKP